MIKRLSRMVYACLPIPLNVIAKHVRQYWLRLRLPQGEDLLNESYSAGYSKGYKVGYVQGHNAAERFDQRAWEHFKLTYYEELHTTKKSE